MKIKFLSFIVTVTLFVGTGAFAIEPNMVNGAAPLPKGKRAFSLDFGADLPEPILYGARFDWGLTKRYQFGVAGNFLGVLGSLGFNNTLNFFRDRHRAHFLSFHFSPTLLVSKFDVSLAVNPSLAYEWRYGKRKPSGLFFKFETLSFVDLDSEDLTIGERVTHSWRWLTGLQIQSGKRFAFTIEAGIFAEMDFQNPFPMGKLGFTWGF